MGTITILVILLVLMFIICVLLALRLAKVQEDLSDTEARRSAEAKRADSYNLAASNKSGDLETVRKTLDGEVSKRQNVTRAIGVIRESMDAYFQGTYAGPRQRAALKDNLKQSVADAYKELGLGMPSWSAEPAKPVKTKSASLV